MIPQRGNDEVCCQCISVPRSEYAYRQIADEKMIGSACKFWLHWSFSGGHNRVALSDGQIQSTARIPRCWFRVADLQQQV
jgi:hypothetical protein